MSCFFKVSNLGSFVIAIENKQAGVEQGRGFRAMVLYCSGGKLIWKRRLKSRGIRRILFRGWLIGSERAPPQGGDTSGVV